MVLDYVLHHPDCARGVVVSAPPLGKLNITPALLGGCCALNWIWPKISLKSPLEYSAISKDPSVVDAYLQDNLVHNRGTPRLAVELWRTARSVLGRAQQMSVPFLIVHGAADRLTRPEGSRQFVELAGAEDKSYLEYPGGYHELHNDLERERVLADVLTWLQKRI